MHWIKVERTLNGARNGVTINDTTDAALVAAARRAERLVKLESESRDTLDKQLPLEPALAPRLFSDATYQLDAEPRADVAHRLVQAAVAAGMLSAGYIEVSATSIAALDTFGRVRYFEYTEAQYSVTVRDPQGTGSGWAGDSTYDWRRIDAPALSALALEKCLKSRHPVAVEPGRYTTILEAQAVCDLLSQLVSANSDATSEMDRVRNDGQWSSPGPFYFASGIDSTKLGEQIADARVTIGADPMDPECGFPPFNTEWDWPTHFFTNGAVYHPATWIERGILTNLAYNREYAATRLGRSTGLPNSGAFRMSGGSTSVEEMIASTTRGLLVTRFDSVQVLLSQSQLCRGYTRDGLWLIEHGRISKPLQNMAFTESIFFVLNNIEQFGVPQRTFHPNSPIPPFAYTNQPQPVIVPPLKIRDFSFTALADAV